VTTEQNTDRVNTGRWLRVLIFLLTIWEPLAFALAAAGAFNAVFVRGLPVVVVLMARLATTALCIAAGRALDNGKPSGPRLARFALLAAWCVTVLVYVTPYFPTNRLPGQTPFYVAAASAYYGGWLAYLGLSKRVRSMESA
jgi:hypothetical protein